MDVRAPLVSLSPSLDMRLLTALVGSNVSFTSGDLARITGASRSGVGLALERLTHAGIVDVETHGRTNAYRLNRDHVLADAVIAAAGANTTLRQRAGDLVAEWRQTPVEVVMFGSTARGDGDPDSDIDVLVVRPDPVDPDDTTWSAQLADFQLALQRWSGNPCELLTLSQSQWREAEAAHAPITAEVRRDGVCLWPPRAAA